MSFFKFLLITMAVFCIANPCESALIINGRLFEWEQVENYFGRHFLISDMNSIVTYMVFRVWAVELKIAKDQNDLDEKIHDYKKGIFIQRQSFQESLGDRWNDALTLALDHPEERNIAYSFVKDLLSKEEWMRVLGYYKENKILPVPGKLSVQSMEEEGNKEALNFMVLMAFSPWQDLIAFELGGKIDDLDVSRKCIYLK